MMSFWTSCGSLSQISSGPYRLFTRKTAPGWAVLGEIKALEEGELVAGDEVGCVGCDQVGRLDWLGAKAQVRRSQRAGLLGVIVEIALGVVVGVFADDLDGVLVGADRTIRTQAKEQAANGLGMFNREIRVIVQAGSGSHLH